MWLKLDLNSYPSITETLGTSSHGPSCNCKYILADIGGCNYYMLHVPPERLCVPEVAFTSWCWSWARSVAAIIPRKTNRSWRTSILTPDPSTRHHRPNKNQPPVKVNWIPTKWLPFGFRLGCLFVCSLLRVVLQRESKGAHRSLLLRSLGCFSGYATLQSVCPGKAS